MTDQELVDQYIATRGVTRCPAAICADSTAVLSPEDAAAHVARNGDPVGDAWRAKWKQQAASRLKGSAKGGQSRWRKTRAK